MFSEGASLETALGQGAGIGAARRSGTHSLILLQVLRTEGVGTLFLTQVPFTRHALFAGVARLGAPVNHAQVLILRAHYLKSVRIGTLGNVQNLIKNNGLSDVVPSRTLLYKQFQGTHQRVPEHSSTEHSQSNGGGTHNPLWRPQLGVRGTNPDNGTQH